MLESTLGLSPTTIAQDSIFRNPSTKNLTLTLHLLRSALRVLVVMIIILVSIICPNFDSVMGFAGSALCYTICIILPLLFYVKMFEGKIGGLERIMCWVLIVVASVMAGMGTVWAVVPREALP